MRLALPIAILAAFAVTMLPGVAAGTATIDTLESDEESIGGPVALARPGDVLLRNDRIRVIISAVDHAVGGALSGGRIIDAAPRDRLDRWGQALLALSDDFPRQVRYTEMEIPEGTQGRVSVVFRGTDSRNDKVLVETVYALREGDPFLTVTSEYRNDHRRDLDSCIASYYFEGGRLTPFLPRFGFLSPGEPGEGEVAGPVSSLLFRSEGVVYGWHSDRAIGVTPYEDGAIALTLEPFSVRAKSSITLQSRFYVWEGDIAGLIGEIDRRTTVPITGRVVEEDGEAGVPGARVEIRGGEGIVSVAESGEDGRFRALLPPGIYRAVPTLPSGLAGEGRNFNAALEQSREIRLRIGRNGEVRYRVEGEDGRPLPAKLTVRRAGRDAPPTPRGRLRPTGTFYTRNGSGTIELPPGRYRITASHGVEYSIDEREVSLGRGGDAEEVAFRLARQVSRGNLAVIDLHQRTAASLDCATTLDELRAASLAAGLDAFVVCDRGIAHGREELNRPGAPIVLGGEAIVLPGVGSFDLFPLYREDEIAVVGPDGATGKPPDRLFRIFRRAGDDPILQLCNPRRPGTGYFETMGVDPVTGLSTNIESSYGFDLLEVANGTALELAATVLRDWFHLLNLGEQVFATGNSSAGSLDPGTVGIPRCYADLQGREATGESILGALRTGRFFVSTAPLLDVTVNGRGRPGDLVPGGDGLVDLAIRVDAPDWVDVNKVRAFANGAMVVESDVGLSGAETRVRLNESLAIYQDTWIVVVVTGTRPLGAVAEGPGGTPVRPVAFSNPVWIDFDLNGRFDLPGVR